MPAYVETKALGPWGLLVLGADREIPLGALSLLWSQVGGHSMGLLQRGRSNGHGMPWSEDKDKGDKKQSKKNELKIAVKISYYIYIYTHISR